MKSSFAEEVETLYELLSEQSKELIAINHKNGELKDVFESYTA